jgi:(1->4)-alpha-D-glucan 1-alpha-D-glucosylmutase
MTPTSTYRLQLHAGFTFEDAAKVADYLHALGVSHVYCSPYLQAVPGSMHGYDVVDHQTPNEELGGEAGLDKLCKRLKELGLGQVLDIVPNHMAIGQHNNYWWDVLENGPSSRYAEWFDIDWNPDEVKLQNKVLIPVLGDHYGRVLSAGQIKLEQTGTLFTIRYMDHSLPVTPRSIATILRIAAKAAKDELLGFIADSFSRLPTPGSTDRESAVARHRDKKVIFELLKRLCEEKQDACKAIQVAVDELNHNCDLLDELLNQQNYRLAYWRTADQELGYRRFFDVVNLIGLRMEREHVFEATHCRILEWLRNGTLDGVRIDHPDGLRDPQQYFERLRGRAPGAWIVAEKILEPGEEWRESWPIQGTSGYDFLNLCNGLLVREDGLKEITETYRRFTGELEDFKTLARAKKLDVQHETLGSDVNRLTDIFVRICARHRDRRDHTRAEIRRALRELAASFPVYRTYVVAERDRIVDEDRICIAMAVTQAKEQRPDLDSGLFDFIADVLSLRVRGENENEFLVRFQQFTAPVMAKGVEDTAFYCFNRMIGLNEVGGDPGSNGVTLAEFHAYCEKIQSARPLTMSTLSTHDTKRADDVRARLATLTEIPDRWKAFLKRWSSRNRPFRTGQFPDPNTEYFLYQTMIGAWPISKDRLMAYMEKATREAKQKTSWTQQNTAFEDALRSYIERIMESQEFVEALEDFVKSVLHAGRVNSLAQTLIKLTAPGIPDTYQGSELWDHSLVDPDNRRTVGYELRRQMLSDVQAGMAIEEILSRTESGMPKLWVVQSALNLRRKHPEWFGKDASYRPLMAEGSKSEHLIGFLRGYSVAVCVPRWPLKLHGNWAGTTLNLPSGPWKNLLAGTTVSGGRIRAAELFDLFPVALLIRDTEVIDASI